MRFITCASYFGTGSSAITDFVSEFDDVCSMTDYEFRFLQDPQGVSDLEFCLVQNHNRHNSGHSLKMYKKMVDYWSGGLFSKRYDRFFHGMFKQLSYKYIDQLTDFSYKGYWYYDVIEKGRLYSFCVRAINKMLQKTIWRKQGLRNINELPCERTLCSNPNEAEFLSITKNYILDLFTSVNYDNKSSIMVDQLVPPSNVDRYLRYFDDIKVFVVDRDPRDLYVLAKYVWKIKMIPTEDSLLFSQWYKYTRKHRDYETYNREKVLLIQFEDLVYMYNKTSEAIMDFLGFTEKRHVEKFKYFNPSISIFNTQVWKKYPE